ADLLQAVGLKPAGFNAYVNLAEVYKRQQKYAKARAQLDKAIEQAGGTAFLYRTRAEVYLKLKQPEDALGDLGRALERASGGPDAAGDRIRRGRILEGLGRHAEALKEYDAALTALPDDRTLARFSDELAGVHRFRARCLRELGSTGEALGALDRHPAVRPRGAGAPRHP